MRKKALLLLIGTIFFIIKMSMAAENYDFRKSQWGMTKVEVKNSETSSKIQEKENSVVFEDEVAGLATIIVYDFKDNQLVNAGYMFQEKHTNKNDYIFDYKKIKEILVKKYGEPAEEDVIWRNDLYKQKPEEWGTAIAIGHLLYIARWEEELTEVMLAMNGDNFKINFVASYVSVELKEQQDKKREEINLEQF